MGYEGFKDTSDGSRISPDDKRMAIHRWLVKHTLPITTHSRVKIDRTSLYED